MPTRSTVEVAVQPERPGPVWAAPAVPEPPGGRRRTAVPLSAFVLVLLGTAVTGLLTGSQAMRWLADDGPVPVADPVRRWVWLLTMLVLAGWIVAALLTAVRRTSAAPEPGWLAAERARILRTLHDTVLQDLEVMALDSELDRAAPAEAVAHLRGTARSQAVRLRRAMTELMDADRPGTLAAGLTEVVAEYAATGLRVELVVAQGLPELTPGRRDSACEAVRAALGNVVKHAGVTYAVVRADRAGRGVEVVVRDGGVGFDSALRNPGFGVRQSIVARLRQVGGTATVESSPGLGTRVRLWVPR